MQLSLLTPERVLLDQQQVSSVQLPTEAHGYIEIREGHAALVSLIDIGALNTDLGIQYFVAGGFVEVRDNQVHVLADVIEVSTDIDKSRAELAQTRAQKRLKDLIADEDEPLDVQRAMTSLRRSMERLRVAP